MQTVYVPLGITNSLHYEVAVVVLEVRMFSRKFAIVCVAPAILILWWNCTSTQVEDGLCSEGSMLSVPVSFSFTAAKTRAAAVLYTYVYIYIYPRIGRVQDT